MTRRGPLIDDTHGLRRDAYGRWILLALVVSLVLHGVGFNLVRNVPVESMSDAFYERIVPRTFLVERVDIDPRLLEPQPEESASSPKVVPITLPDEKITPVESGDVPGEGNMPPALDAAIMAEKPSIPEAFPDPESPSLLERADDALRQQLLKEMAEAFPSTPALPLDGGSRQVPDPSNAGGGSAVPGFSNLDALLEGTGPLKPDTAPILLPGDVLFEYDDHRLQPRALESLEKLARILSRNPRATFVIEGHSDSFGPPDYNLRLSEQRAESVKAWLTGRMGIEESRIQTRGLGQTRLIVPATESVDGQLLNRRVEIVIQNTAQ